MAVIFELVDYRFLVVLLVALLAYALAQVLLAPDNAIQYFHDGKQIEIKPVEDGFIWQKEKQIAYRPFKKGKYNMTMGLKKVDLNEWLLMDETYGEVCEIREKVITENPDQTVLSEPIADEAVREIYNMMIGFMVKRYPMYFVQEGRTVKNTARNTQFPLRAEYFPKSTPIQTLIRIITKNCQEDFLLMMWDEETQQYRLRSGSFAFPSGFDPSYKLNMTLKDIHGPVPLYKEKIEFSMDKFFAKLKVGQWVQRVNWAVQAHTNWYAPTQNHSSAEKILTPLKTEEMDFDKVFMRCERQWLTRLPKTNAIVFTIRTYLTPMSVIKQEGRAMEFIDAILALPDNVAHYKNRPVWGTAVTEYLASQD